MFWSMGVVLRSGDGFSDGEIIEIHLFGGVERRELVVFVNAVMLVLLVLWIAAFSHG